MQSQQQENTISDNTEILDNEKNSKEGYTEEDVITAIFLEKLIELMIKNGQRNNEIKTEMKTETQIDSETNKIIKTVFEEQSYKQDDKLYIISYYENGKTKYKIIDCYLSLRDNHIHISMSMFFDISGNNNFCKYVVKTLDERSEIIEKITKQE